MLLFFNTLDDYIENCIHRKYNKACRDAILRSIESKITFKVNNEIFIWGCKNGYLGIIKHIINDKNININYDNDFAFRTVCFYGHLDIVKILLSLKDNKININCDNDFGFKWSCAKGHLDLAEYLLSIEGNNININHDDDFAFRRSCENGQLGVVKYLLSIEGNNINIHSHDAYAFRYASINGHSKVAQFLQKIYLGEVVNLGDYYYSKNRNWYIVKKRPFELKGNYVSPIVKQYPFYNVYCSSEEDIVECLKNYKSFTNNILKIMDLLFSGNPLNYLFNPDFE